MPSEDHLKSLTGQSISIRNDVTEVERQLTELEAQLNAVRAESQTKDNELDEEIMVRARAQAREIVQTMYDMLPAELCAYIFSYLVPHNTIQDMVMVFAHDFPHTPTMPIMPVHPDVLDSIVLYTPPTNAMLPVLPYLHRENTHPPGYIAPEGRIFHPDFVSEAVALEAARLYYRMNTFKVSVTVPQHSFRRLLEVDRFQFGLEPFNLIRRLILVLPAECCHRPRNGNRQRRAAPIVGTEELDRLTQHGNDLSANLALIPQENRQIMEFTFIITMTAKNISPIPHWDHERYFLNMLMCIREIVYDTRKYGSEVKVCARFRGTEPVDVSTLFSLSVDEWQNETEHSQLDVLYIPPDSVEIPNNANTESHRARAREFWGYESFETLLVRPSRETQYLDDYSSLLNDTFHYIPGYPAQFG